MRNKNKRKVVATTCVCTAAFAILLSSCFTAQSYEKTDYLADKPVDTIDKILPTQEVSKIVSEDLSYDELSFNTNISDKGCTPAFVLNGIFPTQNLDDAASRSYYQGGNNSIANDSVSLLGGKFDNNILRNVYSKSTTTVLNNNGSNLSTDTAALNKLIAKYGSSVSFLAVRLRDGASIGYNTEKMFQSCSLIKAPLCLYVAKLISEGKLDANQTVTYLSSHYSSGSGKIKNSAYGTKFRIKTLVEYSLLYSDNIAHNMLCAVVGTDGFFKMLDNMNCNIPTDPVTNWPNSNAKSAVLWWSEINSYIKSDSTGKWLGQLLRDNYSKANVALNKQKTVYSKGGSSNFCFHETGIVMGDEPYIYAVYTRSNSGVSNSYFINLFQQIDKLICG